MTQHFCLLTLKPEGSRQDECNSINKEKSMAACRQTFFRQWLHERWTRTPSRWLPRVFNKTSTDDKYTGFHRSDLNTALELNMGAENNLDQHWGSGSGDQKQLRQAATSMWATKEKPSRTSLKDRNTIITAIRQSAAGTDEGTGWSISEAEWGRHHHSGMHALKDFENADEPLREPKEIHINITERREETTWQQLQTKREPEQPVTEDVSEFIMLLKQMSDSDRMVIKVDDDVGGRRKIEPVKTASWA